MRKLLTLSLIGLAAFSRSQLKFEFDFSDAVSPSWRNTVQYAANQWSSRLTNRATIKLSIDATDFRGIDGNGNPIPNGTLGVSNAAYQYETYANFRGALAANTTKSAADLTALAHLEAGSEFSVHVNDVEVERDGNGNIIYDPYLGSTPIYGPDGKLIFTNQHTFIGSNMRMTTANAKALGLLGADSGAAGSDGTITFATDPIAPFDFDPTDGIGASELDALGLAMHEIGHTLGFLSDVDVRDYLHGFGDDDWDGAGFFQPLDLFRYQEIDGSIVRSSEIGDQAQFFSLDGSVLGQRFSTGSLGNGFEAGHWYENVTYPGDPVGTDLMRPRSGLGRGQWITENDLLAFDAIGWNVAPVPEPVSVLAMGIGVAGFMRRRIRSRVSSS